MNYAAIFICLPPNVHDYFKQAVCSAYALRDRCDVPFKKIHIVTKIEQLAPEIRENMDRLGINLHDWKDADACTYDKRVNKITVIDWFLTNFNFNTVVCLDTDLAFVSAFSFEQELLFETSAGFHVGITEYSLRVHLGVESAEMCVEWRHPKQAVNERCKAISKISCLFGLDETALIERARNTERWINGGVVVVNKSALDTLAWKRLKAYAVDYCSDELAYWCVASAHLDFKLHYLKSALRVHVLNDAAKLYDWALGKNELTHIIHFTGDSKFKVLSSAYTKRFNEICERTFSDADFSIAKVDSDFAIVFSAFGEHFPRYLCLSVLKILNNSDCPAVNIYCYLSESNRKSASAKELMRLGVNVRFLAYEYFSKLLAINACFSENKTIKKLIYIDSDCFLSYRFSFSTYFEQHASDRVYASFRRKGFGMTCGDLYARKEIIGCVKSRIRNLCGYHSLGYLERYMGKDKNSIEALNKLYNSSYWVFGGLFSITRAVYNSSAWAEVTPLMEHIWDDEVLLLIAHYLSQEGLISEINQKVLPHIIVTDVKDLSLKNPLNGFLHAASGSEFKKDHIEQWIKGTSLESALLSTPA